MPHKTIAPTLPCHGGHTVDETLFAGFRIDLETLKLIDACSFADRFWIFAGGLTNVEVDLTVRDTETGETRLCQNPPLTAFQPIQDTDAFATCP